MKTCTKRHAFAGMLGQATWGQTSPATQSRLNAGNTHYAGTTRKVIMGFGKAMAIAVLLNIAMATQVRAQTVTVGTTSASTYFPFFTNSSATAPVVGNSNVNETGGSLNVGDGEFRVNTYGGFGTCFIEARNAASTGTIDMTLRTLNSGTVFNNVHMTSGELLGINSDEYTGGTAPTAPLDLYQNSGGSGTTAIFKIWDNNPTQRFTVLGNGKVGIGVSAPTNFLDLKSLGNTSSTNAFNIVNSSSTQLFEVRDDGNVGIGTSSPGAQLDQELSPGAVSTDITGIKASTTTSSTTHTATGISVNATNNGTSGLAEGINITANGTTTGTIYGINNDASTSSSTNVFATYSEGDNTKSSGTVQSWGVYGNANVTGGLNSGSSSYGVFGYGNLNSGASLSSTYGVYGQTGTCTGTNNTYYAVYGTVLSHTCGGTYYSGYFNGPTAFTSVAWTVSDEKLKDNIQPLSGALDNLMKLKPKSYTFKTQEYPSMYLAEGQQMGLIAQDVEQIYPNLVGLNHHPEQRDDNGKIISAGIDYKGMNYTGLIPVTIAAIQEQQGKITAQQDTITKQQSQISAQEGQISAQQNQMNGLQSQNAQLQNSVSNLQDQLSTVLAEIENIKAMQAQCCGSMGSNTKGNNNNGSNVGDNSNDEPSLAQNVPNPFNQNTVINYYLPSSMPNAVITVRSMNGSTVQSFNISTPGHGQITVNGGTLAPGTYEYDMIVNGKLIDSKKMVLIGE